jgi:hypothetical protein
MLSIPVEANGSSLDVGMARVAISDKATVEERPLLVGATPDYH